ncbi:MAG: dihydroorotase [Gammaproteobacteria bacterium]|jgi:dihydroorotase
MDRLYITRPDDWHLHLRDGEHLKAVVNATAAQFGRAIIMPNLTPPVKTCLEAEEYYARILSSVDPKYSFKPLMTLYLTDNTRVEEIRKASQHNSIFGAKLYPAGATTNSDAGVTNLKNMYPVFEAMQELRLVLQIHGEVTGQQYDIFDREKIFIDQQLEIIHHDFPQLPIVFEHITTQDAVDFVKQSNEYVAATITPHHLLINRNEIFKGGINPHHYCLPIAKREEHRLALLAAASSGSDSFFAGTDSAPHSRLVKQSACGCAGIYSAYCAVELYAEAFSINHNFDHFESFMSFNGPNFYNLPINQDKITLVRSPWEVPSQLPFGDDVIVPFRAGQTLQWKIKFNA